MNKRSNYIICLSFLIVLLFHFKALSESIAKFNFSSSTLSINWKVIDIINQEELFKDIKRFPEVKLRKIIKLKIDYNGNPIIYRKSYFETPSIWNGKNWINPMPNQYIDPINIPKLVPSDYYPYRRWYSYRLSIELIKFSIHPVNDYFWEEEDIKTGYFKHREEIDFLLDCVPYYMCEEWPKMSESMKIHHIKKTLNEYYLNYIANITIDWQASGNIVVGIFTHELWDPDYEKTELPDRLIRIFPITIYPVLFRDEIIEGKRYLIFEPNFSSFVPDFGEDKMRLCGSIEDNIFFLSNRLLLVYNLNTGIFDNAPLPIQGGSEFCRVQMYIKDKTFYLLGPQISSSGETKIILFKGEISENIP